MGANSRVRGQEEKKILLEAGRPQDHSASGRITSTGKYTDLIGNRTRDLPTYNIVTQAATLPRVPMNY
jgi:hypothetical protein